MRGHRGKTELLAPAGSYEALCAVIEAGCDAVYIGGTRFGARAFADNPEQEKLIQGIDEAHLRGVKVYLTVNTVLKNEELAELREYLLPYYEAGLDAVIVQDFGVLRRITEWFPDLSIHASTQMTITHASAALLLPPQVTRIVPARELSVAEIGQMAEETERELEIFAHGALCYCYSGQCLLSSLAGGRSGNRGRCAQPCRKRYDYRELSSADSRTVAAYGFLLSPKDQCLLPRLHELLATGIDSLKLEGRMKKPEYAAGVTAIYRRWLDRYEEMGPEAYTAYLKSHAKDMADDVATLAELYNRGGFCEGYAFDTKGRGMMCTDRPNHTGVLMGKAAVTDGVRVTAVLQLREELGPEEVLELRTPDGFVCGEITTPKDMTRFDPDKPVVLRREAFHGEPPAYVHVFRTKCETLLSEIREQFIRSRRDIPVIGTLRAAKGEPLRLTVTDRVARACVTVTGDVPDEARQLPTTAEQILDKLRRTGGSGYTWDELTVDAAEGIFLPVSKINEIRREALEAYEHAVLLHYHRSLSSLPVPEQTAYDTAAGTGRGNTDRTAVGNTREIPGQGSSEAESASGSGGPGARERTASVSAGAADGPKVREIRGAWSAEDIPLTDGDTSEEGVNEHSDAAYVRERSRDTDAFPENGGKPSEGSGIRCMVVVQTPEQTGAALHYNAVTELYIDMEGAYEECLSIVRAERRFGLVGDVRIGLALPRVSKGAMHDFVTDEVERILGELPADGVMVRTPDQLAEVPRYRKRYPGLTVIADNTMYLANDAAAEWLLSSGVNEATVSPELRRGEVSYRMAASAWIPVYERQTVMISEQCPHRTVAGCRRAGDNPEGILTDAEGNRMPVRSVCRYCHSLIYNAAVTSLLTILDEVLEKRPCGIRVSLTTEPRREAERVLRTLAQALQGEAVEDPSADGRYTKGHWRRGVV